MSVSDDQPPGKLEASQQGWEKFQQAKKLLREQRNSLGASTMREDEAWVRWEYSPEEWALFDKIDWGLRSVLFLVLLVGDTIFFLGTFLPWIVFSSDYDLARSVFLPDLVLCVGFFFALLFSGPTYTQVRKRHIARQKLPHTVTFSKKGVWESGTFFPLNEMYEADLEKVTLTSQPPVLRFYFKKWSWDSKGSGSSLLTSLRVLVPHGQEGEAGLLLERFQTEVIAVRKQKEERGRQEQERRKNPPEPRSYDHF